MPLRCPIAVTSRSGFDESVHRGAVVALDRDGSIAWSVGDPDVAIYARSALKPLQAAAMVAAGLTLRRPPAGGRLRQPRRAPRAPRRVRAILAGAGLDEACLENTPTLPLDADAMHDAVRGGVGAGCRSCRTAAASMPGCWRRRCSTGGRPPATPRADHPLQRLILDDLAAHHGRGAPRRRRRLRCAGGRRAARPGWPAPCAPSPSTGTRCTGR